MAHLAGAGAGLPGHCRIPFRGYDRPRTRRGLQAKEAQMSAGLTDSDTIFSVRETPWYGLGSFSTSRRRRSRRPSRRRDLAGVSSRSRSRSIVAANRPATGCARCARAASASPARWTMDPRRPLPCSSSRLHDRLGPVGVRARRARWRRPMEVARVLPTYYGGQGVGPRGRSSKERLRWLLEPTPKSAS
jgi:hypothetical protein